MEDNYSIQDLFQDIANNAAADRAGAWLELAAQDYPALFDAITNNLHAPPSAVIAQIQRGYPMLTLPLALVNQDLLQGFISRLQAWFKEREGR